MGRLKELVNKVKEEVKPIASVVKDEVASQVERVKDRVIHGSKPSSQGASSDEWAFKPMQRAESSNGGSSSVPASSASASPAAASAAPAGTASASSAPAGTAPASSAPAGTAPASSAPASAAPASPANGSAGAAAAPPAGQVRITAQPSPTDPDTCKFTVEVAVHEDRLIRVKSREQAEHSPLAKRLFDIPQVAAVTFAGNVVTVTKQGPEPWQLVARQVGPAIRAFLASGESAVSPTMPSESTDEAKDEELAFRVQGVIESMINPGVAAHGGFVTLLGVRQGAAWIQMGGGCQGCGAADLTLKQGIITTIKAHVPEIDDVLDATDHSAGENPFYR